MNMTLEVERLTRERDEAREALAHFRESAERNYKSAARLSAERDEARAEVERLREVVQECITEMTQHADDCPKSIVYEPRAHGKSVRPPGCDCGDPDVYVSETVKKARAALAGKGGG